MLQHSVEQHEEKKKRWRKAGVDEALYAQLYLYTKIGIMDNHNQLLKISICEKETTIWNQEQMRETYYNQIIYTKILFFRSCSSKNVMPSMMCIYSESAYDFT